MSKLVGIGRLVGAGSRRIGIRQLFRGRGAVLEAEGRLGRAIRRSLRHKRRCGRMLLGRVVVGWYQRVPRQLSVLRALLNNRLGRQ